jgi:hypothetical protein
MENWGTRDTVNAIQVEEAEHLFLSKNLFYCNSKNFSMIYNHFSPHILRGESSISELKKTGSGTSNRVPGPWQNQNYLI